MYCIPVTQCRPISTLLARTIIFGQQTGYIYIFGPAFIRCGVTTGFTLPLIRIQQFYNLKSQVVYSKQPKLGLTKEFVVDCANAMWVVHSTKRLVSLMLLKWFLSDGFIYFMYRMLNEHF